MSQTKSFAASEGMKRRRRAPRLRKGAKLPQTRQTVVALWKERHSGSECVGQLGCAGNCFGFLGASSSSKIFAEIWHLILNETATIVPLASFWESSTRFEKQRLFLHPPSGRPLTGLTDFTFVPFSADSVLKNQKIRLPGPSAAFQQFMCLNQMSV
jgi:hypothetical protein